MKLSRSPSSRWLLGPLLTLCLLSSSHASVGDRSPAYQRCLISCSARCDPPPPLWTKLTSPRSLIWSCPADCSYSCLTRLTDAALSISPGSPATLHYQEHEGLLEGLPLGKQVQFHGKWPFRRFFSMQEPLSVGFSALNLWAHWRGFRSLSRRGYRSAGSTTTVLLRGDYILNAYIGVNTWIWSAVFHTRDTPWTERADYFSAALSTTYGLYLSLVRIGGLYRSNSRRPQRATLQLLSIGIFLSHVAYLLSADRFDYTYNMAFNLSVGVLQILIWLAIPLPPFATSTASPKIPLLLLALSTALELNDFAPVPAKWRLVDAHSLWHASTAGIVLLWYRFLRADLERVESGGEGDLGVKRAG